MRWSRTSGGTTKTLKMGLVCEPMSRSIQRNGRTPFGLNSRVGEGTCHAKAHAHPIHDVRRCRAVARGPDEDPSGGFAKGAVSRTPRPLAHRARAHPDPRRGGRCDPHALPGPALSAAITRAA